MKKSILIAVIFFSFAFGLTACQSSASSSSSSFSSYSVYTGTEELLTYTTDDTFVSTYQNGEVLNAQGISVFFDGTLLLSNQYFFTTSATTPVESAFTATSYFTSSTSSSSVSFYAAYWEETTVYVTKPIIVTVKNSQVISPWLYYTGGAILVVALGAWYLISAKAKKEGHR